MLWLERRLQFIDNVLQLHSTSAWDLGSVPILSDVALGKKRTSAIELGAWVIVSITSQRRLSSTASLRHALVGVGCGGAPMEPGWTKPSMVTSTDRPLKNSGWTSSSRRPAHRRFSRAGVDCAADSSPSPKSELLTSD